MKQELKLLTMNIGNPSLTRVKRQIQWIESRKEDIFVLTETKLSEGCNYLQQYFSGHIMTLFDEYKLPEFQVYIPASCTGDLGVILLSKYPILRNRTCFERNSPYYSRLFDVVIDCNDQEVGIMGLYVPSRDASSEKVLRKQQFVKEFLTYLENTIIQSDIPYIICGDLNVLERNHHPHYDNFLSWEYDFYESFERLGFCDAFRLLHADKNDYSWVGRTNDGYRYDHCFVSRKIAADVVECQYVHETRLIPITDHSAMTLTVQL